jgi:hypothetical protein
VNIDELKRSIDNYKININEISVQKKDEMVKRQNNFDAGEVIVFLINFF